VLTSEDIFLHVFRAKLSFRALFPITFYRESLSRGDNFLPVLLKGNIYPGTWIAFQFLYYLFLLMNTDELLTASQTQNQHHPPASTESAPQRRKTKREESAPTHILVEMVNLVCVWDTL
jgi:hypothetical protein